MIRKIIHCSDIHIRTFRMHDEYGEAFKIFLKKCRELVIPYSKEEVRIAIVGDLVHNKISVSNELLVLGTWFLKKLEEIAPVIIVAGNHDLLVNNKDRMDSITPMVNLLTDRNIKYFKESKCYLDDNVVWCNYSIYEDNKRPDIESARQEYGDDKIYIGLYHAPIIGAVTDLGYEFDKDHGVGLEHFEGCTIAMLGDIHLRQAWTHKGIPIAYPGSFLQNNFGEGIDNHGFLFWDLETKKFEEHNIQTQYGFYQFKITSLSDLDNNTEKLTNA